FAAQLLPEEPGDFYYLYRYSTTGGRDWVYGDQAGTVLLPPVPGVMHVLPAADTTPPPIPLNLHVVHWGTDHITVQWDPVSADDLAGYDLYRYAESEGPATFLVRVMEPTTIYTDTDVEVNTTYTYTVQAFDMALNKSAFSNPASGTAEAREVEVRFRVTVPPFTPAADTIYIAGDNATYLGASWNPSAMPITQLDATTWAYTVTIPEETVLQYKFTRGSWDKVENWGDLVGEANRHLTVAYGDSGVMTLNDVVYNWRDPLVVEHYPVADATTWDTTQPIWALISRPIDPTRVTAATFAVTQDGVGAVAGTLGVQGANFDPYPDTSMLPVLTGTLVLFTPTVSLTITQYYQVLLTPSGYHDDVDMQTAYSWAFGVMAEPDIAVTPSMLEATLDAGMTASQLITVSNVGSENLIWQLSEVPDVAWLTVDWETVIGLPVLTPPGNADTATVLFDASGLLPGVYTTTLLISSNDPDQLIVYLPVTLTVPCSAAVITSLTSNSPVVLGATMHFTTTVTGSASISYTWDFGGAGTRGGTDTNPTFIYTAADTYTVTLTVENDCGMDTETLVVDVELSTYEIFLPLVMRSFTP
ncbi:MAG: PKD domain-containing protein, partial [Anaerolineae bacterium]